MTYRSKFAQAHKNTVKPWLNESQRTAENICITQTFVQLRLSMYRRGFRRDWAKNSYNPRFRTTQNRIVGGFIFDRRFGALKRADRGCGLRRRCVEVWRSHMVVGRGPWNGITAAKGSIRSEQGVPDLLVGLLQPLEGQGERGEVPVLVEVLLGVQRRRLFEGTMGVTAAAA